MRNLPDTRSAARAAFAGLIAMLGSVAANAAAAGNGVPATLPKPKGKIILTVRGKIDKTNRDDKAVFDRAMLRRLPHHVLKTHTVVTDGMKRFDGFLMTDLMKWVGANGKTVVAGALNDYVIAIPMRDFRHFRVLVATHMDGKKLTAQDKGPLWIVYPRDDFGALQDLRYDYRWVWQLDRLVVK